jgi:arylsulfatase
MENVVLVTYDSVRADHCGHHGYDRPTTPNIDRLAEEGLSFEQAVAPAARTNPSMSAIMTGETLLNRDRVADPELSRRHLRRHGTIAERVSEMGYATAAFCPNAYASSYYGFDAGFDRFEDFLFSNDAYRSLFERHLSDSGLFTALRNVRNLLRKEEAFRTWDTYVDDVVEWCERQDDPFFLWVFALDTHFPYITPREHRRWSSAWDTYYYNFRFNRLIDEFDVDLSATDQQKMTDIYDDALRYGDRLVGELVDRLGHRDPTVAVHADHGEALGEHRFYGHFYPSLYEECIHVPLCVWSEDGPTGTVERPFALSNLPTVLELAAEGSLSTERLPRDDFVTVSTYDGRRDRNLVSVRAGSLKAITERTADSTTTELYDLATDPDEQVDLAGDDERTDPMRALTGRRFEDEAERLAIRDAVRAKAEQFRTGPVDG